MYIDINRLMRMRIQSYQPQSGSIISKYGTSYVHTFDTGGGRSLAEIPARFRHLGSKSGRNVYQTPTLGGRNLVETSTRLRHWGVEV